jgi:hypothetical protein
MDIAFVPVFFTPSYNLPVKHGFRPSRIAYPCLAKLSRTRSNARACSLIVLFFSSILRGRCKGTSRLGTASRCPERASIHELPRVTILGNSESAATAVSG